MQAAGQVIGPDLIWEEGEWAEGQQVARLVPVGAVIHQELAGPDWEQVFAECGFGWQDPETQVQQPGRRGNGLFLIDL